MARILERIGDFLRGLKGRQRLLVAFAAGLVSALGFEPFRLFPCLLLAIAALVLLLDGAAAEPRRLRAFAWCGFAFGLGQFALGLHWIVFPFLVDPSVHAWQIPFVAVLFPSGLALFVAAAAAAASPFWRAGATRIFVFSTAYAIAEWLRGHVLTGFPWNLAAYAWGALPGVMQAAALIGSYALTLLTILLGAALAELFRTRPDWRLPAALGLLFAALWAWGEARLSAPPTRVPGVTVRLVQPDIPQAEKYKRRFILRNWQRLIALSTAPANPPPTVIIWPEAAPPFLLARVPAALDEIALLTGDGRVLMTGAVRREDGEEPRYYNSFYIFAHGGELIATYDKFHLVPLGEYLPFEETLGALGLEKLTGIPGSFAPGDGPHTYDAPGLPPVGPLICYEILFPGEVVEHGKRPGVLVNVTDDSWFGPWAGPRQHLLVARMRAIEEGIPVIRAANTGISAAIDSYGRITTVLALGRTGYIDASLPATIAPTPYSRLQGWWFWLFTVASGVVAWLFSKGKCVLGTRGVRLPFSSLGSSG
jgi:apolipoprotein N-acyltransferase